MEDFVNPQTGARRCFQLVDQLATAGFSVILTNSSGQFDIELAFKQERERATNLVRLGESEVAVTITFPDGSELEVEAEGNSSPTPEATFDGLVFPLDQDTMLRFLAADGDVHFDYLGQQGFGDASVPASAWATLNSGFGETCMSEA